jgi:hypothetical protein
VGKEFLCPKSRTREAGGRVVVKLSMRMRRMRRKVLDGLRTEVNFCGPKFDQPERAIGELFAAPCRRHETHSPGERRRTQL